MQPAARLATYGFLAAMVAAAGSGWTHGAQKLASLDELADLTLEQLARLTVTSASKRAEPLLDAPASIYVVTAEDIRRAGATTLTEALLLAPNLQVVRGDASQVIASARGGLFGTANKMLVLVDGRIVYTPLFAGVFYDAQDVFMENVERIEVISGPGSMLWGTNAVNGVINVITRPAGQTQGALVTALGGSDRREVGVRQGGRGDAVGDWRVHAKYGRNGTNALSNGASARDDAERWKIGFRTDRERGDGERSIQGEAWGAQVDNLAGARDLAGGSLRGRWTWRVAPDNELMLQSYYERSERRHEGSFEEQRDTYDIEVQQGLRHGAGRFVWGADYRISSDRTARTAALAFQPADRPLRFASLYAQEDYAVTPQLRAMAGVRAERNDYTGVEWLPNVRLSWMATPDTLLWSALTRSVRAPSRLDRDLAVPGDPPYVLRPSDAFQSEVARVAEIGWRLRLAESMTFSATAFHHDFRRVRTVGPSGGAFVVENGGRGRTSGVEAWATVGLTRDLRIQGAVVLMNHRFRLEPGQVDLDGAGIGNNPRRTAMLRASWNPAERVELDATTRYMGALPSPAVPGYGVTDVRVGWRATPTLDLALIVKNLFDRRHVEFGAEGQGAAFERSVLLQATWAAF